VGEIHWGNQILKEDRSKEAQKHHQQESDHLLLQVEASQCQLWLPKDGKLSSGRSRLEVLHVSLDATGYDDHCNTTTQANEHDNTETDYNGELL